MEHVGWWPVAEQEPCRREVPFGKQMGLSQDKPRTADFDPRRSYAGWKFRSAADLFAAESGHGTISTYPQDELTLEMARFTQSMRIGGFR